MRAEWVDKNPKAANALTRRRAGGAAVVRQERRTKPELAEIVGRRQWFNVPSPTSSVVSRATSTTATAAVEKGSKQFMKFWRDNASYPVQEP